MTVCVVAAEWMKRSPVKKERVTWGERDFRQALWLPVADEEGKGVRSRQKVYSVWAR